MAIGEVLAPATDMIGSGLAKYGFVLFILVVIAIAVGGVFIWKTVRKKNTQWTHKLKVRRVLGNNLLSEPTYLDMRRFPLIKKAEVFELKTALLGGFLFPELDQYSKENEFSIILDKNNRIYTNTGEYFNPSKSCADVSAKHSEIDIQRSNLKADFQNINVLSKRIEWATIAKYAFMALLIIVCMVVAIVALQKWGEAREQEALSFQAQANAMESLAKAMETVESAVNTQNLLIPKLKELYGTNNLQGIINEAKTNENI